MIHQMPFGRKWVFILWYIVSTSSAIAVRQWKGKKHFDKKDLEQKWQSSVAKEPFAKRSFCTATALSFFAHLFFASSPLRSYQLTQQLTKQASKAERLRDSQNKFNVQQSLFSLNNMDSGQDNPLKKCSMIWPSKGIKHLVRILHVLLQSSADLLTFLHLHLRQRPL